jgi:hypothetical protein
MVGERNLIPALSADKRPWFVMQNKGDMMSSIAFMYNYIAFFADTKENKNLLRVNPFDRKVLIPNKTILRDPLCIEGVDI